MQALSIAQGNGRARYVSRLDCLRRHEWGCLFYPRRNHLEVAERLELLSGTAAATGLRKLVQMKELSAEHFEASSISHSHVNQCTTPCILKRSLLCGTIVPRQVDTSGSMCEALTRRHSIHAVFSSDCSACLAVDKSGSSHV